MPPDYSSLRSAARAADAPGVSHSTEYWRLASPEVVLGLLDRVEDFDRYRRSADKELADARSHAAASQARLAAAEAVVAAAWAVYDADDSWTMDLTPAENQDRRDRDHALGKALRAYDATGAAP